MRLRAVLRRFIDRFARQFARLRGRVPSQEDARTRPAGRVALRFTAVRPGPFSPPGLAAAAGTDSVFITPEPAPLPFGDFTDRGEAERFAVLPPICVGAADEIDWDALARALTGER